MARIRFFSRFENIQCRGLYCTIVAFKRKAPDGQSKYRFVLRFGAGQTRINCHNNTFKLFFYRSLELYPAWMEEPTAVNEYVYNLVQAHSKAWRMS